MENLNAEQVKKALECCCGDIVECQKCAYVKNGYNRCKERASQDALALITSQEQDKEKLGLLIDEIEKEKRELWEERNRIYDDLQDWKAIAEQYQKQFEDCAEDRAKLTEENERLRSIPEQLHKEMSERMVEEVETAKKYTVLIMQSEIKERCIKGGIYPAFVASTIDQIAKEMLEDTNEEG